MSANIYERNALVWGIVGNLGGGKTLSGVQMAVSALVNGWAVVSNVTIDVAKIRSDYGLGKWVDKIYFPITLDDPSFDPWTIPCGDPRGRENGRRVVVILDEVAEWIGQYANFKNPKIEQLHSWLRQSSKRSQDVVFICQRQQYVHKAFRDLIARWIWVDDLGVYKIPHIKIKFPFCRNWVMQNTYDRMGNRLGSVRFVKKQRFGRYYDTAQCLNQYGASVNLPYVVPPVKYRVSKPLALAYVASILLLVKIAARL